MQRSLWEQARLLLLVTSRPDHQPMLGGHPRVGRLSLNRLGRASVQAIVSRLGGDSLQARTVAAIVARADGVPLFVEELTKAVLETGETLVPASLYDSLMARLDHHLPEVKEVAQLAACIGREFDQALFFPKERAAIRCRLVCGMADLDAAFRLLVEWWR